MALILVVDDEAAMRNILQELLSEEGYQTALAVDGRDALRQLETVRPDLVLSDVMMPFMGGLELARTLAQHPQYHAIPVVLMSAGMSAARMRETPHAAYVGKPFNLEAVLTTLHAVLADHHREEASGPRSP
jgi:CheY-like chemotaxis protein